MSEGRRENEELEEDGYIFGRWGFHYIFPPVMIIPIAYAYDTYAIYRWHLLLLFLVRHFRECLWRVAKTPKL